MKKLVLLGVITAFLVASLGTVMAIPTTNNPKVDTYGFGAATVLPTGNKLVCPSHLQDWYAGNHYNCFRETDLSSKKVNQKLDHGWTRVGWPSSYWSDNHLIQICGSYICKITAIDE